MTYYFNALNDEIKTIKPIELEDKLMKDNIIIVDVRETEEFANGHIPLAISIPLGDFADRTNELDKEKDIYVICRSGARSDFASKILFSKGFTKVVNVVPGMMDWNGDIETH